MHCFYDTENEAFVSNPRKLEFAVLWQCTSVEHTDDFLQFQWNECAYVFDERCVGEWGWASLRTCSCFVHTQNTWFQVKLGTLFWEWAGMEETFGTLGGENKDYSSGFAWITSSVVMWCLLGGLDLFPETLSFEFITERVFWCLWNSGVLGSLPVYQKARTSRLWCCSEGGRRSCFDSVLSELPFWHVVQTFPGIFKCLTNFNWESSTEIGVHRVVALKKLAMSVGIRSVMPSVASRGCAVDAADFFPSYSSVKPNFIRTNT